MIQPEIVELLFDSWFVLSRSLLFELAELELSLDAELSSSESECVVGGAYVESFFVFVVRYIIIKNNIIISIFEF